MPFPSDWYRAWPDLLDDLGRPWWEGGSRAVDPGAAQERFPPINVWACDEGIVITVEVPGVPVDALDIAVRDDVVSIRGNRPPAVEEASVTVHRRERRVGGFARTITLPFAIDADHVGADYADGVLTVQLPRLPAERPKKIRIQAG